jgi:CRISPR/Cas system type I-B associated protein Csh2 (Cas7 group RAMP superfamily)
MITRTTGLLVLEVRNSNPNGDPDRDSDPRQRPDGLGEISPVSVKRKARDLVLEKEGPVWQEVGKGLDPKKHDILEARGRKRDEIAKLILSDPSLKEFHERYWDARVFGNTFLEKEGKSGESDDGGTAGAGEKRSAKASGKGAKGEEHTGQNSIRTGAVHFGLGLSVAPIEVERMTMTNKAGVQEGKDRGMAPMGLRVVRHAVYWMPFFVNPTAANRTFCTEEDVDLLFRILPYIYDHTRSAVRPMVGILHAWVIEHKTPLGSFSDFQMLDALRPKLKLGIKQPQTIEDYLPIPSWEDVPEDLRKKAARGRDLLTG